MDKSGELLKVANQIRKDGIGSAYGRALIKRAHAARASVYLSVIKKLFS